MSKAQKAILKTLAFFDIFSRPLTFEEIYHFLYKFKTSKLQVLIGLKKLKQNNLIDEKNAYYYLKNSSTNFKDFCVRKEISAKRLKKVEMISKILRLVPFVKNISIINSLSFEVSNENSDIDLLIVAAKNRLWTVRAIIILLLELFSQNKNKWKSANKFCLGFAFDETKLSLEKLRLSLKAGTDVYFTYWLACLRPVVDQKIYEKLIYKENSWIFDELPNWEPRFIPGQYRRKRLSERLLRGNFGQSLENKLSIKQINRILSDPKVKHVEASVVADAHVMKLHHADKRREYYQKWQEKLVTLGIK